MNRATIHHFQGKSLHGFPLIWDYSLLLLLLLILYIRNYHGMAAWKTVGMWWLTWRYDPPKLRRSSVLLIGVLILLVLFFVLIVIVLLFGLQVLLGLIVWLGWLMVHPHVDEQVGDVVMHGRCQPPALLSQLGVVCYGLLHLLLLCAKGGHVGREIRDAPQNRILIVKVCWW